MINFLGKKMRKSSWTWFRKRGLRYDTRSAIYKSLKNGKLSLLKTLKLLLYKRNCKRHCRLWENIYKSDKELVSKMYKELQKCSEKITHFLNNGQKISTTTSPVENIQMVCKHMKKCSRSLAIGKMQIKATMRS